MHSTNCVVHWSYHGEFCPKFCTAVLDLPKVTSTTFFNGHKVLQAHSFCPLGLFWTFILTTDLSALFSNGAIGYKRKCWKLQSWECDDMIDQIRCEVCQQVGTNLYDLNLYKDLPNIGFIRFYLDHKTSIEGPFSGHSFYFSPASSCWCGRVFFSDLPNVWNKTLASLFQVWAMWEWPLAFHQACPALCSPCWGHSPKTLAHRWWFFQQNQDLITTLVHSVFVFFTTTA